MSQGFFIGVLVLLGIGGLFFGGLVVLVATKRKILGLSMTLFGLFLGLGLFALLFVGMKGSA